MCRCHTDSSCFVVVVFLSQVTKSESEVHSQKKKVQICHWGCTFSKGKLLSILGANMYSLGQVLICIFSDANMYILGANMYI